jgi:hypothetical protein
MVDSTIRNAAGIPPAICSAASRSTKLPAIGLLSAVWGASLSIFGIPSPNAFHSSVNRRNGLTEGDVATIKGVRQFLDSPPNHSFRNLDIIVTFSSLGTLRLYGMGAISWRAIARLIRPPACSAGRQPRPLIGSIAKFLGEFGMMNFFVFKNHADNVFKPIASN